jgi:ATP-dependent exoDNAse (exonuclease V) alpha subunit
MSGAITDEQHQAATAICTSGRGAELVVGAAGAGKTTMLKVVAGAYRASGCQVIGTATSGQAARTLGRESKLGEARTLASLLWRLDHDQLDLDDQSVVILDEAGMTEDAHLVALMARVEAAGAKLVIVGDHHQLGAVGPGGALAALVRRHPDAVHPLLENRRQHDPAERNALAELRDGNTGEAVAWYTSQGRIRAVADSEDALQQAVDAWAADIAGGHDTGLYAWRRTNVAALNQKAREWMDATDRLSGPELTCPGGNGYRAGDRVVTLAPGPDGKLVTSQRAVVQAVDPSQQTLTLLADDGQHVRLGLDQAGADRLSYGYATTVHRSQGSTVDRAHLFADGGGRELAYVAMSRARASTQVWTVADDIP